MERVPYISIYRIRGLLTQRRAGYILPKGIAFPSRTKFCLTAPSGFADQPLKVFSALLPAQREEAEVKVRDSFRLWNNTPPVFAVVRIAEMRFESSITAGHFEHFASQGRNMDFVS